MTQEAPMSWAQLREYIKSLKDLEPSDRLSKLREACEGLTHNPHSGNWMQVRKRLHDVIEAKIGEHGEDSPADWDPHHGRRSQENGDPNIGREEPPPIPDPSQEPDIEAQGLPTFMLIALRFTRDQITSDKAISEITKLAGIAASAVAQAALLVILTKLREKQLSNSDAEEQIQQLAIEHPAVEPEQPVNPPEVQVKVRKDYDPDPAAAERQIRDEVTRGIISGENAYSLLNEVLAELNQQPEVDPETDPPQKPKEGDVSDHDHNDGPDAGRNKGGNDVPPTKNRGDYPENPWQARVRIEHDATAGLITKK